MLVNAVQSEFPIDWKCGRTSIDEDDVLWTFFWSEEPDRREMPQGRTGETRATSGDNAQTQQDHSRAKRCGRKATGKRKRGKQRNRAAQNQDIFHLRLDAKKWLMTGFQTRSYSLWAEHYRFNHRSSSCCNPAISNSFLFFFLFLVWARGEALHWGKIAERSFCFCCFCCWGWGCWNWWDCWGWGLLFLLLQVCIKSVVFSSFVHIFRYSINSFINIFSLSLVCSLCRDWIESTSYWATIRSSSARRAHLLEKGPTMHEERIT